MRSIEEKIKGIEIISTKYDDLRKDLVNTQDTIVEYLKELINKYAEDFSLIKNNSIRSLKLFRIVYRVKEKESFSEKLIRNNDYNHFYHEVQDLQNVNQTNLKNKIKELDDLIGLKILTDLSIDSINMFKLISSANFIKDARDKGIEFNTTDIESQPVTMKNGLPIFKIRCTYDTYKFELQIKSKLESAWGDMEHAIFYKDYKVTPVRDLAQNSMNHIGKLLLEIDDFLKEIRHANDDFSSNSEAILFMNNFEEKYATKVGSILKGFSFNFKKIASLTYNISKIGYNVINTENINIEYLSFSCEKYEKYINYRNTDFNLQIFESIILSNENSEVKAENIEQHLDNVFNLIKGSYVKSIVDNNIIQDSELSTIWTEHFFETCIKYNCKEFTLNTKNVLNHFENLKLIYESIEVLELDDEKTIQILNTYTIYCFNGDIGAYIQTIDKDILLENLEKSKTELKKITGLEEVVTKNIDSIINKLG